MYAGDELYGDEITTGLQWLDWDDHLADRQHDYDPEDHTDPQTPHGSGSVTVVVAQEVTVGQTVRNPFTGDVFTVTSIEGLVTIDPNCRALLLRGGELGVTLFLGETIEVLA